MSNPHLTIQTNILGLPSSIYSDARLHPPQLSVHPSTTNATRNVSLPRAVTPGGSTISRSEDGVRCAVAGTECKSTALRLYPAGIPADLRIIRMSDPDDVHPNTEHKSSVGPGGYRADASRNMWEGSALKSTITDIEWCRGLLNHKILTSARNGELIMWDLNKSGPSKYETKAKDHSRSIHKLAVSPIVQHYCITGSADGDLRAWDIREMEKSRMRIHHPTAVRGIAFCPSPSQPLQAIVGLDNGSIYRWELRMGQRGLLDRLPVAHTASVTSLDWRLPASHESSGNDGASGLGWIVSSGLDRCVKVWDVSNPSSSANSPNAPASHIPHKPTYTLHPSFPIRRVLWRPGYECELAVVSNANSEFGSGNFSELAAPVHSYASALKPGSAGTGGGTQPNLTARSSAGNSGKNSSERSSSGVGDAVEIWDVRRGWIAKWTVRGSSREGGVTDIAFRDSHAIWATHASGMFSQMDLRDATKPIDAIPRMSAAWDASGSLAFVSDRKLAWEVPYDDIRHDLHLPGDGRRKHKLVKSIGDESYKPHTQAVGTYANETLPGELETYTKLARGYIFEGEDRPIICEINAQTAFEVGKTRVAEMWLLLATALTTFVPEIPRTGPQSPPPVPSALHTSASAPAAIAANYSFPPTPHSNKSPARSSSNLASPHEPRSSSTSRKLTPTSSNASSPHLQAGTLPPVTPRPTRPPYMVRRQSGDSGIGGGSSRRPSTHHRRSSMSTGLPSSSSASPSNTRHAWEMALDDSDSSSSGSGGSTGIDVGDEMTFDDGASSSDNDSAAISPSIVPTRIMTATRSQPSPLSKIAELYWPENEAEEDGGDEVDEEDASSPSPISTDTDESGNEAGGNTTFKSPLRHWKSRSSSSISRRPGTTHAKSRSRSSTLAALPATPLSRTLVHQSSRSSILTVTAGDTSFQDAVNVNNGLKAEETLRDIRSTHRHQKSLTTSGLLLGSMAEPEEAKELASIDESKLTDRRMEFVYSEEDNIREMTLEILREALEGFADEGDVQTCAMLALVAPQELCIKPKRILQFLESYIDILRRLQLHTCAAYLRKFCQSGDVYKTTLIETQIYTSCGKCRKPLVIPAGASVPGTLLKGGFAFCLACKTSCVTCAICRLPVRTLLFQCSICHHGGHQACYRRYYMEHPMIQIPGSSVLFPSESRGRRRGRAGSTDDAPATLGDEDGLAQSGQVRKRLGHPCVTGCGHWCWAAIEES